MVGGLTLLYDYSNLGWWGGSRDRKGICFCFVSVESVAKGTRLLFLSFLYLFSLSPSLSFSLSLCFLSLSLSLFSVCRFVSAESVARLRMHCQRERVCVMAWNFI